ncbi:MAG: glutamine-hydrolyzing carbamoyl-phosphate synthase small subunit [Kiloniellaceae bacterium]
MNDTPESPPPSIKDGPSSAAPVSVPEGVTGALVLADGSVFWGKGLGAAGRAVGEVCFNTSMTGYQEICTDPSYAGEIITFTFPHVGNVGSNPEDIESLTPAVRGVVLRADITEPSNWRNVQHFDAWLRSHNLVGLAGVDSRAITRRIRDLGAPHGTIVHFPDGKVDIAACRKTAAEWPGLEGMDLAAEVSCRQTYHWDETGWELGSGYGRQTAPRHRVVAVDYGAKRNILRCLSSLGCDVTVVPADTTAEDILGHRPDGVFLSNGPGDPAATGIYAVPTVKKLLDSGLPVFGICLGHQILALALGARTAKMRRGHRGANHPVKDLTTGKVEITSQNHGFMVDTATLPEGVVESHISLFDGTNEGIAVTGRPVFSVQYHPEASPGPRDSHYLFERFVAMIDDHKARTAQNA